MKTDTEKWRDFIDKHYKKKLLQCEQGKDRLTINFQDLSTYEYKLADKLLDHPQTTIQSGEQAIKQLIDKQPALRIKNLPKSTKKEIRKLRQTDINKLITIEGTISIATDVHPSVTKITYECNSCGINITIQQNHTYLQKPNKCKCGGRNFNTTNTTMEDIQRLVIEENIENLEITDQPRRIDVILTKGLTNYQLTKHHTPGNKLRVSGTLQEIPKKTQRGKKSKDRKYLLKANHIEPIEIGYEEITITPEEEKQIKQLSQKPNIINLLTENYAPEIYGHDEIKKTIILQLFGGNTLRKNDGKIRRRGNIHILLIGDPGIGKTQIAKKAYDITPKCRYTSGATSTAAGLTATVIHDDLIGGFALNAGVLVLANKGTCIIDEFDKTREEDLGALHEAMSEGTISINKADIHTTLPSETSVLAAANPKFGRFDPLEPISRQIDLPPALISRFDFVHIFKDEVNPESDSKIMQKILEMHEEEETQAENHIPKELIKKYISYAKKNIRPQFTTKSKKLLKKNYVELRNRGKQAEINTVSITHRYAEALIRLSQASAKARLNHTIQPEDVQLATQLIVNNLKQIAMDPETGLMDIDYFVQGESTKDRNVKRTIIRTVKEIQESTTSKLAEIDEVIKQASEKTGQPEEKIEDILHKLRREGEVYEPRNGKLKIIK